MVRETNDSSTEKIADYFLSSPNKTKEDLFFRPDLLNSFIPHPILDFFKILLQEGFLPTIVGGAVRDLFLYGGFGEDFDIEIRPSLKSAPAELSSSFNKLGGLLEKKYGLTLEKLAFGVLKVTLNKGRVVELCPPRIDKYPPGHVFGHSEFEAEIVLDAPYFESFRRRDLSINAMGIEVSEADSQFRFKFIDPFGGLNDFKAMTLRHISEDFFKDPVRLLRLVRFHLKTNFKLHDSIKDKIIFFNLEKCSLHYFFKEAYKSDFFSFQKTFFTWVDKFGIKVSSDVAKLSFLSDFPSSHLKDQVKESLTSDREIILFLIFHSSHQFSTSQIDFLKEKLHFKQSEFLRLCSLRDYLENSSKFSIESITDKISNLSWEEIKEEREWQFTYEFYNVLKKIDSFDFIFLSIVNEKLFKAYNLWSVLFLNLMSFEARDELEKNLNTVEEKFRGSYRLFFLLKEKITQ